MVTGDRLLKIVTGTLIVVFVVFAGQVIIRELVRIKDPLTRLVNEQCSSLVAVGTSAPPGASFLPSVPATVREIDGITGCFFLDASVKEKTELARAFFAHERVRGWDYLYLGPRGVLVVRDNTSFASQAAALRECIRAKRCGGVEDGGPLFSLTLSLVSQSGKRPVTVSFYDKRLTDILREAPSLLAEMCEVKKEDIATLLLEISFHQRYAFIGEPSEETVAELSRPGRDGLFLASRGAKIRLLPWEYRTNPLRVLATKGVSYGLEKEEYRKEIAMVKIFMTERYREEGARMISLDKEERRGDEGVNGGY